MKNEKLSAPVKEQDTEEKSVKCNYNDCCEEEDEDTNDEFY